MNKIYITIYNPQTDESYDIFVPINKKVGTVKNAIISSIKNLDSKQYSLIVEETGQVAEDNVYIKNSGITNGSKLLLL